MSRFGIVPQNVTIYPSDVIDLSFRAGVSPALYEALTNATVTSSYVLDATTNALFVGGFAQRLLSHIGSFSITLDSNSIPDTGGSIYMSLAPSGDGGISATIGPTSTVVKDWDNNTLDTITHTAASGDVFKIEAAGSSYRFYINGTLESEHNNANPTSYPVSGNIIVTTPMTSGLIGEKPSTPTLPLTLPPGSFNTYRSSRAIAVMTLIFHMVPY